jgi:selenocysteine lyase/cysteine desulfurase
MGAIRAYEQTLSREMLGALARCKATVYGIGDPDAVAERAPTVCFNLGDLPPAVVAERMAQAGVGVRDGHMYAPRLMARLGLTLNRGAVRASLVHYNTVEEIRRFEVALFEIAKGG